MLAKARPPAVASPLWTGFYIGVHGGGGWGTSGLEDPDFQITYSHLDVRSSGWLAGAQVGADWQFGSFVVGGQLDAAWASVKGSATGDGSSGFLNPVAAEFRALATGTGRVGYATGNFLGYAKGGLAWANIDFQSGTEGGPGLPIDVNHQRTGWTVGAGLEMLVLGNLSALVEYDFIDFGPASISLGTRRTPSIVDHQLHLLKLGLNWRFNGDYLVARY
jgi:outer membrane immunogenic protein